MNRPARRRVGPKSPSPGGSDHGVRYWHLVLVAGVAIAVYLNTLSADFVWDDRFQIVQNPAIKDLRFVPRFFTTGVWTLISPTHPTNYYRPMMFVSYLITYYLFGLDPVGFHVMNVAINALVALMVYALAFRLFRQGDIALIAGLLFAVHPIHTEAVAWVASLPELVMALFYLLSFHLYLRANDAGRGRGIAWRLASLAIFFVSLLSKEMALTLPFVLALYEHGYARSGLASGARRYSAYFVLAALYLAIRSHALGGFAPVEKLQDMTVYRFALSDIALAGQYWWKLLLPVRMNAFHMFEPSASLLDARVLLGALTLAVMFVLMVVLWKAGNPLWLAIAWVFVTLLPVLYIKGVGANVFAERYLYLPSVGFCVGIAYGFHRLTRTLPARSLPIATGVLAGVLMLLSIQTVSRAATWRNEITLFSDTVAKSPSVYLVRNFLGIALLEQGRLAEAREQFVTNQKLDPDNEQGFRNEGAVDLKDGRLDEAVAAYRQALKRNPGDSSLHRSLALVLLRKGARDLAVQEYEEALRLDPDQADVHSILAEIYAQNGSPDLAIRHYLSSAALAPTPAVQFSLGYLFARKGAIDLAIKHYAEAIRLNPRYAEAHNNLGALYLGQNRLDDALREFEQAAELNPAYAEAFNNLGTVYYHKGSLDKAIDLYNKALSIDPSYVLARDNLQRVTKLRHP
jgi:tetratricopeptide (TPR) repeat protein